MKEFSLPCKKVSPSRCHTCLGKALKLNILYSQYTREVYLSICDKNYIYTVEFTSFTCKADCCTRIRVLVDKAPTSLLNLAVPSPIRIMCTSALYFCMQSVIHYETRVVSSSYVFLLSPISFFVPEPKEREREGYGNLNRINVYQSCYLHNVNFYTLSLEIQRVSSR